MIWRQEPERFLSKLAPDAESMRAAFLWNSNAHRPKGFLLIEYAKKRTAAAAKVHAAFAGRRIDSP